MVLCDGLACRGFIWKYFLSFFSRHAQMLHWHYPGHGESSLPIDRINLSMGRLADDLTKLLDRFSISQSVIVGHSLGVQVALETARRHPHRVRALVLLSGVSGRLIRSISPRSPFRLMIPVLTLADAMFPQAAADLLHRLPSPLLAAATMWTDEINARLIRRPDLKAYFDGLRTADFGTVIRMARFAAVHDAAGYLADIRVPTLVMGGRLDRLTPPERLSEIASAIPGAELTLTRRGSHALPVEQPDFVNLRIRRFLEEHRLIH